MSGVTAKRRQKHTNGILVEEAHRNQKRQCSERGLHSRDSGGLIFESDKDDSSSEWQK